MSKLKNGLFKIDDTRIKVEAMSVELEDAKKKVAAFQKQCEEYLVVIVQQKRDADEQQKVCLRVYLTGICLRSSSVLMFHSIWEYLVTDASAHVCLCFWLCVCSVFFSILTFVRQGCIFVIFITL